MDLDRFAAMRPLGHGATGSVFEAFDRERGERVALKLFAPCGATSARRIEQEFHAAAGVAHPNLVALYELFAAEDGSFFSMELVEGEPFDDWAAGLGLGAREALIGAALQQLASAVDALHRAGTLHRDLKPSNVLVTTGGRVVVLDFGLASELVAGESPPALFGTPAYLAPELAPSVASDWYAVGVMLFQALTGRLPFEGSALRVIAEKRRVAAPDPRALGASDCEGLCRLCDGLLERDPDERWGSAEVLALLGPSAVRSAG